MSGSASLPVVGGSHHQPALTRADPVRYARPFPPGGAKCDGIVLGGDSDRSSASGAWLHIRDVA